MADNKKPVDVPATEIATLERGNSGQGAELSNVDPFQGRVGRYSTIDTSTTTGKIRTFRAMSGDATPLDSVIDKPIKVEHVVLHGVDITDPITGEVKVGTRVVLVGPQGSMWGCVSAYIVPALRKAGEVYGPLPWTGGQWIIPKRGISKAKRPFYYIDVPDETEVAKIEKELAGKEAKAKAAAAK